MIKKTNRLQLLIQCCLLCQIAMNLYAEESTDTTEKSLEKMKIIAEKSKPQHTLAVSEIEMQFGVQEDVNHLIAKKAGILQVPETGSQLLINGGSPFDNQFFINQVPLFVPAHFSGHHMFDISSLILPTIQSVHLATHTVPGNYAGYSHAAIHVQPGFFAKAAKKYWRRPEILLNLNNYDAVACIVKRFRKGKDLFQLSCNVPNTYYISHKEGRNHSYIWWDIPYFNDPQRPLWFQDVTFTGASDIGKLSLYEHAWLAIDAYSSGVGAENNIVPWGCGSISIKQKGADSPWQLTVGGSKQYQKVRKIYSKVVHKNRMDHSNLSLYGELKKVLLGDVELDFAMRAEAKQWKTSIKRITSGGIDETISDPQKEVHGTFHIGALHGKNQFVYGVDAIVGGFYNGKSQIFIDPGIWAKYHLDKGVVQWNGGIITSWPDIRGYPSESYRRHTIKTYTNSLLFRKEFTEHFSHSLQSFIKWQDHCPRFSLDPYLYQWDPMSATPLMSMGISYECAYAITKNWQTAMAIDVNRVKRKEGKHYTRYEWEVPWAIRPTMQCKLLKNKLVTLFISGYFSEGIPYRDLVETNYQINFADNLRIMPWYKRIDCKFVFVQPIKEHRFFTSFQVIFDMMNVFDLFTRLKFESLEKRQWENEREYYWNYHMIKKPVYLERSSIKLGIRSSFKL